MPLVILNDALGTYVDLVHLAEVLGFLLGVLEAELVGARLLDSSIFFVLVLLLSDVLLRIEVVKDRKVLNLLSHIWGKVRATCRARQNIGCTEVHQARLAESVSTCKDAGNPCMIIVRVVANWTGYFKIDFGGWFNHLFNSSCNKLLLY